MRMAVAVDEDIDIYSTDDLLWAIMTRANQDTNIFKGPHGARAYGLVPASNSRPMESLREDWVLMLPFHGQKSPGGNEPIIL